MNYKYVIAVGYCLSLKAWYQQLVPYVGENQLHCNQRKSCKPNLTAISRFLPFSDHPIDGTVLAIKLFLCAVCPEQWTQYIAGQAL